jgi:hypothetical protein
VIGFDSHCVLLVEKARRELMSLKFGPGYMLDGWMLNGWAGNNGRRMQRLPLKSFSNCENVPVFIFFVQEKIVKP